MEMATSIEMNKMNALDFPETGCNYYSIIEKKLNELAKRKADIELLQKVLEKGERVLTLKEQRGISQYEEVVAQLELNKDFFETFDKEKLQTFSKTEGGVETTMMKSRTSDNIQTTSTSFLSTAFQRNEILRLRKLLDEASKRELDLKNKSPSINTSIHCVNVSQIMDIMRALVPVIKDYKKDLILLGHVINGFIFALSAVSIVLIVIFLFSRLWRG